MRTNKSGSPMTSMMVGEEDKPAPEPHPKPGERVTTLAIGEEDPKVGEPDRKAGAVPGDNPLGGW